MKCETCGKREATNLSRGWSANSHWLIECNHCHPDDYWFEIGEFDDKKGEASDWIAHLFGKPWWDADDFCYAVARLRLGKLAVAIRDGRREREQRGALPPIVRAVDLCNESDDAEGVQ
jgi:hypothetical protein